MLLKTGYGYNYHKNMPGTNNKVNLDQFQMNKSRMKNDEKDFQITTVKMTWTFRSQGLKITETFRLYGLK